MHLEKLKKARRTQILLGSIGVRRASADFPLGARHGLHMKA